MSQIEATKRHEGLARTKAREAVEREAAQRELNEKLRRIEILRNFSQQQFSRLNRSITISLVWIVVIAGLGFAAAWYAQDAFQWGLELAGYAQPKK